MRVRRIRADLGQRELQLAYITTQVGEEPMVDQGSGGVIRASRTSRLFMPVPWADSVALRGGLGTRPKSGGGVHQPEVHVAMISEGREYAQVIRVQPCRSEYRQALREVAALRLALEPGQSGLEALHRARHSKLFAQPTPEL